MFAGVRRLLGRALSAWSRRRSAAAGEAGDYLPFPPPVAGVAPPAPDMHDRADPAEALGPLSERTARAFLEAAGYRIIQANYRCPLGELDLIAAGEGKLVFVEVKARQIDPASPSARPEDAVDRRKQRQIGRAAKYFCRDRRWRDAQVRFDVIAIDWPPAAQPVIRHHQAAFRPNV